VAARTLAPAAALPVFHAIQNAFYAQGLDVTQGDVLAATASAALKDAGFAIDAAAFLKNWNSTATIAATNEDFVQVQRWGVTGFPTLVLEREGQLDLVASGYTTMPALVELLQQLVDRGTDHADPAPSQG
jgi:putative protein-disulfide isomerase